MNILKKIVYYLIISYTIIVAAIFTFYICYFFYCSESINFEETEKRGDSIVTALKEYHEENNKYPQHLDSLEPKFIDNIPYVATNTMFFWVYKDFEYYIKSDGTFRLSAENCFYDFYHTGSGNWYLYNE